MNILILHNNSLPNEISDMGVRYDLQNSYTPVSIEQSVTDRNSFDKFVTDECKKIFTQNEYDLVVLSFNLSAENHADYSGVTLGLHLRLSKQSRKIPLLFLGMDRPEEVAKITDQGSLFFTPKVFVSTVNKLSELEEFIAENKQYMLPLTDKEYRQFLSRVKLGEIENYGPHAIANIWAVKRWQDMMFDEDFNREITDDPRRCQLYFKYIDQLAQMNDERQAFKKTSQRYYDAISGISGKKIVYIDDEVNLGWGKLMERIFKDSHARVECWQPSEQRKRIDVIADICSFIDMHNDADCYIVDLRLAEEDVNETDYKKLTGHAISRYIKELNKANQIVIFTASNKIWNLKEEISEIGALGYALKESPSMNLGREGSISLFADFSRLVYKAICLSQLKSLVSFQKNIDSLTNSYADDILTYECINIHNSIELLLLDKELFGHGEMNIAHRPASLPLVKSVILTQFVFVEEYFKRCYELVDPEYTQNKRRVIGSIEKISSREKRPIKGNLFLKLDEVDGHFQIVDVSVGDKRSKVGSGRWELLSDSSKGEDSALSVILSAAYAFYDFSESDLRFLLKYKKLRDLIAHRSDLIEISYAEIEHFYLVIIKKILKTDYPEFWPEC